MGDKIEEKKIIDFLLEKYPALNEFLLSNGERFNLKKKNKILEIIDTDEDKDKYNEWEALCKQRKGIKVKKKVEENIIEEEILDDNSDNNSEESESVIDNIEQISENESINEDDEHSKKINEYITVSNKCRYLRAQTILYSPRSIFLLPDNIFDRDFF